MKVRACSFCRSLAASQGPYYWKLSIPLTLFLFRGHRGLRASQAQLGSLQW